MNLKDKSKPFLECKYSDGDLIKYEDVKEAVKDILKFINEGYILVEDREYFQKKYKTKNWYTDKDAIRNIFGDYE